MTGAPRPHVDLDLYGKQARHSLLAAARHTDKADNLRKSAGLLLIEAKQHVPHGQWMAYLTSHKIKARTAQEAMQFAGMTPEEQEAVSEKNAEACQRYRETGTKSAGRPAHLTAVDSPVSVRPKASASVTSVDHTRALRAIKKLTPEQVRAVLAFIDSLSHPHR